MALYQNGDVDFLVATDAIGMGLNLDIARGLFCDFQIRWASGPRAFLHELAQIAGRAGRHMAPGTPG